ncbi:MAG: potassium channel family protein [Athalassotoga sp.]|uniref:potassium channel family protein n=1 Tax=Athalassotoga sp. TaxID=2022597 RepID=UPI003CFDD317
MEEDSNLIRKRIIGLIIGLVSLGLVILCGTFGYMYIEKWDFLTSFFWSVITLSTVGYGIPKNNVMTSADYIFIISLIVIGISIFLYTLGNIASFLFDGDLRRYSRIRKKMKKMENLKDHCIIAGGRRGIGKYVAIQLAINKYPFVFVARDKDYVEDARSSLIKYMDEKDFYYIVGDITTDESILMKAGIKNAKSIVIALTDDSLNVHVSLIARSMNKSINIVSEALEEPVIKRLNYAGANSVISPVEIAASRMSSLVLDPSLRSFTEIVHKNENVELKSAEIPVSSNSKMIGKTIQEIKISEKTGLILIAIRKGDEVIFNPPVLTEIESGMTLIVMGNDDSQFANLRKA